MADLFSVIDASNGSADVTAALPGTGQLAKGEDGNVFVVRAGVYRADGAEGSATPRADRRNGDIVLTR